MTVVVYAVASVVGFVAASALHERKVRRQCDEVVSEAVRYTKIAEVRRRIDNLRNQAE